MEVKAITERKLKSLTNLPLDKSITNTEGSLYKITYKQGPIFKNGVLKMLYNNEGPVFANKLYTIQSLMDNKDIINSDSFVLPEKLVTVDNKAVGFVEPFIDGQNLSLLLSNNNVKLTQKIDYLKQVGQILNKMKNIRKNSELHDFYLNDLHEGNFVVSNINNKVYAIDLDSCKINENKPFAARYLTPMALCNNLPPKYKINNYYTYPGHMIANEDSDLYCYNIMILNLLYGSRINNVSISEFYVYTEYLKSIGLNEKLIDSFNRLLIYKHNSNPCEYLDDIDYSMLGKANSKVFRINK